MAEPPPTLREQAVEAGHRILHESMSGSGNPCPFAQPVGMCGNWLIAERQAAVVWPFAERAALDRAEKALRERAADAQTAIDNALLAETPDRRRWIVMEDIYRRAADLVASLRPEEPEVSP